MNRKLKKYIKKLTKTVLDSAKAQSTKLKSLLPIAYDLGYEVARVLALFTIISVVPFMVKAIYTEHLERKVASNVIYIRSPEGARLEGSGTAFEVKAPSGKVYTVTNAHVCGLQKDGYVLLEEKRHSGRLIAKRVLEVYEENDLCLVEGLDGYEGLDLANSVYTNESVWSAGYPLGQGLNIAHGRVKGFGKVDILDMETPPDQCTGPNKKIQNINMFFFELQACIVERMAIHTDVATYPGNSGSPLLNAYGNVTGVIFASMANPPWGEAVPLSYLKDLLKAY